MGFNTGLLLLNDALSFLDEPSVRTVFFSNLLASLNDAARFGSRINIPIGSHANGATIFHMQHADVTSVYAIGGNTTLPLHDNFLPELSKAWSLEDRDHRLVILQTLAAEIGYEVKRKE